MAMSHDQPGWSSILSRSCPDRWLRAIDSLPSQANATGRDREDVRRAGFDVRPQDPRSRPWGPVDDGREDVPRRRRVCRRERRLELPRKIPSRRRGAQHQQSTDRGVALQMCPHLRRWERGRLVGRPTKFLLEPIQSGFDFGRHDQRKVAMPQHDVDEAPNRPRHADLDGRIPCQMGDSEEGLHDRCLTGIADRWPGPGKELDRQRTPESDCECVENRHGRRALSGSDLTEVPRIDAGDRCQRAHRQAGVRAAALEVGHQVTEQPTRSPPVGGSGTASRQRSGLPCHPRSTPRGPAR